MTWQCRTLAVGLFGLRPTRAWSLAIADAVKESKSGAGTAPQVLPVFSAPPIPSGTAAVNPGALTRLFVLVQSIKEGGKSTETINTNLGLLGSELTPPGLALVQPALGATVSGSLVNVKWGWGGLGAYLSSCEIQVDRNDGKGFVLLTIDTTPNYVDTNPFPAPGASALWKYKAIYRKGDERVGQWSDVVSVVVAG